MTRAWLCFSDGTRELERRPYASVEAAHAEAMRRNSPIERAGLDEAGYWYVDDETPRDTRPDDARRG